MSPLRYLSTLKISQLIQALAGAAHIAYEGGLGVLGSCLCDVCVRDVAVGTAEVLCILPFSEVSNPPPSPLPFPSFSLLPFSPPPKAQKLVDASTRAGVRGGSQCPVVSPRTDASSDPASFNKGRSMGLFPGPGALGLLCVWLPPLPLR